MKNYIYYLLFLCSIGAVAQTGTANNAKYKMQSPTLGTKSDSIVVWNGTDKFMKYLPSSAIGGSGGDFIPLSGTEVGSPVTGEVLFDDGTGDYTKVKSGRIEVYDGTETFREVVIEKGKVVSSNFFIQESFAGVKDPGTARALILNGQTQGILYADSDFLEPIDAFGFNLGFGNADDFTVNTAINLPFEAGTERTLISKIVQDGTTYEADEEGGIELPASGGSGVQSVSSASSARLSIAGTSTDPILDVVSAPKLETARTIGTITGDATSSGSSFNGTVNNTNALTLATVNANVGTFGSATQVIQQTVDAKGRTTAASNVSIQIAESQVTNLVSDLAAKVTANTAITGATKTKITYDSKGLVTSGADATTADIADTTNKRYQTDAQNTNNNATSPIQAQIDGKLATPTGTASAANYLRGDNLYVNLQTTLQNSIVIGANNGTGVALTATTPVRKSFWDLQMQLDAMSAMTLTATATLNFPSTAMNQNSQLTVTVTGAAIGDVVVVNWPSTIAPPTTWNGTISGFVSAANTVTVIFMNNDPLAIHDLASATFTIKVLKQ